MHPLYRPIVLIICLCAVIIGLNVFVLFGLQAPAAPLASSQADRTPSRVVEPPPAVAPCEPTVAGNEGDIAERNTVIARLEEELESTKQAHDADESAWRAKAAQIERDLSGLQKAAERVMEMDAQHWHEGQLILAHAMIKKRT